MRKRCDELPGREALLHADFAENIPIPMSHAQTSDMFHGAQRKTLSIFGAFIVQRSSQASSRKLAVVLVSDVIEKSAAFANECIQRALSFVEGVGNLDCLRFCFDSGNHFRSYENAHLLFHAIPVQRNQRCCTHYLVEKHGKGPDDSEIFARVRAWLAEYLLQEDAFVDTEAKLVSVLKDAAEKETRANRSGTQFHIEVFNPGPRPEQKTELSFSDRVTRSYCWESVPRRVRGEVRIQLRNWVFSDAQNYTDVSYTVNQTPVAEDSSAWRRGYWQECSWRKPALDLAEQNEITRRFAEQLSASTARTSVKKRTHDFDSLVERDERRLRKAQERRKRKCTAEQASSSSSSSSS